MPQAAAAIAAPVLGAGAGALFGGSSPQASQAVPQQLQGLNQKSIQGLMTLLGFGGPNPWNPQQQQAPQQHQSLFGGGAGQSNPWGLNQQNGMPQSMQPQPQQPMGGAPPQPGQPGYGMMQVAQQNGGPGALGSLLGGGAQGGGGAPGSGPMGGMTGQLPGNVGGILGAAGQGQLGMNGMNQNGVNMGLGMAPSPMNGGQGTTGSPMDQVFGNLGQPLTQLQQQSLGGMSNYFNSPAPETQALNQSMPMLQNLLGNNPGAGVISALQPFMQQGLNMANQQGGRFGSANAVRQSQVINDYGLMASQAAQQGVTQQLQGANQLGILSSAAGQNPFGRLSQAFGTGQSAAGQNDVGLQRALQLMGQGAFGQPTTVSPSGLQQGAQMGGGIGQIIAMLGGGGGGGMGGTQLGQLAGSGLPGYQGITGNPNPFMPFWNANPGASALGGSP